MKHLLTLAVASAAFTISGQASAFSVSTPAIHNGVFKYKYGYCRPNWKYKKGSKGNPVKLSGDMSPAVHWRDAPKGTKSFVVILRDPDSSPSAHFDQHGYTLSKNSKRLNVYHWMVADIPAHVHHLAKGAGSTGFVAGGKKPGMTKYGLMGVNVYTDAFNSPYASRVTFKPYTLKEVKGTYGKYDGPCAPWNDTVVHDYTFDVYALNVLKLKLPTDGKFRGKAVIEAMKGHVIGHASVAGKFITNPSMVVHNSRHTNQNHH